MQARQTLRAGDPRRALTELQDAVRQDPANFAHRTFLFELLAVTGDWDRALAQLNVAGQLDDSALAMMHAYRGALECEAMRAAVFGAGRTPLLFGEPEQWIAELLEALRLEAHGQLEAAEVVRARAFESAPATRGSIEVDGVDGPQPFEWIADADPRIGPMLEAYINGSYYWVPFERIKRVQIEAPEDLRDLVWVPAFFTWANGGEGVGMVPTRYPGSETVDDGQVMLARRTEWQEVGTDSFRGLGQRMLATDSGEYPLLQIRDIQIDSVQAERSDG